MELFPAIDLRGGAVVRLLQGERDRQTTYSDDPTAMVDAFREEGARWLHVVNLDGAFADTSGAANQDALRRILQARGAMSVQVGGGLRGLDDIEAALSLGASRAIIGSAAVDNPALVRDAVARFGASRIVVGVDARGGVRSGEVKTRGWTEGGAVTPLALVRQMVAVGVERFIYTDIGRDGMQMGPDVAGSVELARESGAEVIVSGGVGALDHLQAVVAQAPGASPGRVGGVVVGKALYEGAFSAREALAALAT
ncbi:MAG: 1-(5-phosphoribosyl)-5-((5-phosphoribosylamino)methylideneamino)imidazole-4-carboxamide isomerase [Myxococcales bacterium]|nr:1-(5-phosphoribosyl)-5-((5-phosphoribosylamino)methylideneamino)imidazole-4-carboxamide isomerase [Myxococcales bacterium]